MSKVRCVKNIQLNVINSDGKEETRNFRYGAYYKAKAWQQIIGDDEYINIILEDNSIIKEVNRHIFENFKTPITQVEMESNKSTEPIESIELTESSESIGPIESTESTQPTKPTKPAKADKDEYSPKVYKFNHDLEY